MELPFRSWSRTLRKLGLMILESGRSYAAPPQNSSLAFETLESRIVLTVDSPWYNTASPADVNGDGLITSGDVYAVVSALHNNPAYTILIAPTDPLPSGNRADVNNDGLLNVADFNTEVTLFNDAAFATTNWWSGTGSGSGSGAGTGQTGTTGSGTSGTGTTGGSSSGSGSGSGSNSSGGTAAVTVANGEVFEGSLFTPQISPFGHPA